MCICMLPQKRSGQHLYTFLQEGKQVEGFRGLGGGMQWGMGREVWGEGGLGGSGRKGEGRG